MYKKVYVEITNICNLACPFCIKNQREQKFMSKDELLIILEKLKKHTKYLYFHVLGEPLMHPLINDFITLASHSFFVNITTNGYLIEKIISNNNIRQINISLHSFDPKYNITLKTYMNNIFKVIDRLKSGTHFSLRLWANNSYNKDIIQIINEKYKLNLDLNNLNRDTKIIDNVFLSKQKEFTWPSLENKYYNSYGTCYALKDHIGILCDGTVIPCCLDSKGIINLGNIFKESITAIKNKEIYLKMSEGFKNNKKCEELCKRCNFIS